MCCNEKNLKALAVATAATGTATAVVGCAMNIAVTSVFGAPGYATPAKMALANTLLGSSYALMAEGVGVIALDALCVGVYTGVQACTRRFGFFGSNQSSSQETIALTSGNPSVQNPAGPLMSPQN